MSIKQKTTIFLMGFVMIFAVFIAFVILPLISGIQSQAQEFVFQKKTLLELETKINNLKAFKASYETHQSDLAKIDSLFIDPAEPLGFISFLERQAQQSQLLIEISPVTARKTKEEAWPSMSFQLTLRGDFPDFLKFLERLEASSYLVESSNLAVSTLAEEGISVSLLTKVYTK